MSNPKKDKLPTGEDASDKDGQTRNLAPIPRNWSDVVRNSSTASSLHEATPSFVPAAQQPSSASPGPSQMRCGNNAPVAPHLRNPSGVQPASGPSQVRSGDVASDKERSHGSSPSNTAPRKSHDNQTRDAKLGASTAPDTVVFFAQEKVSEIGTLPGDPDFHNEVDKSIYSNGLRLGFAEEDDRHVKKSGFVSANYFDLKLPPKIWVYSLEIIRHHDPHNGAILMKKPADCIAAFEKLTPSIGALANANEWVTDGQLIWSSKDLLNYHSTPPLVDSQILAPNVDLSYHNECGSRLTVSRIKIWPASEIDTNVPMSQAFEDQHFNILLRGLNAMLTRHGRQQSQSTMFTGNKKAYRKPALKALENNGDRGELLRAFRGLFVSSRPGMQPLLVNVNSICSPFYASGQTLQACLESSMFDGMSPDRLTSLLAGLKVNLNFHFVGDNGDNAKIRFVREIKAPNAECHRSADAARRVDVPTCFRGNHNCAHRTTPAIRVPTTSNKAYCITVASNMQPDPPPGGYQTYPADVLTIITDQPFHGALTPAATTIMIKKAQEDASDTKDRISREGLNTFGFNARPRQSGLIDFGGLSMETDMLKVPALWLHAPKLRYYKQNRIQQTDDVSPQLASWDLRGRRFAQTTNTIDKLHYVNLSRLADHEVRASINVPLQEALRNHGVSAASVSTFVQNNIPKVPDSVTAPKFCSTTVTENLMAEVFEKTRPTNKKTPLSVVLPNKDAARYSSLKRVSELQLGLHTVMVQADAKKMSPQKASNIAMKWNLKLAQVPHILPDSFSGLRGNTIVIGADVTHPGKGAGTACPSIAAVVGSTDDTFMHFPGSMRLQRNRKEYIVELGDMVKERLIDWADKHDRKSLPQNILFYRDGVSESQYAKLRSFEIPEIQKAYNWAREFLIHRQRIGDKSHSIVLDPARNPWPPIANPTQPGEHRKNAAEEDRFDDETGIQKAFDLIYIVVGKRHNTRLFPTLDEDKINPCGPKRNTNAKPGLLVDKDITHPVQLDFYLQSHQPIAGTGRSAHYVVLQNGMKMDHVKIQEVTHDFCYAYAKATRGISYCVPAYYADRLCDRGRAYLVHCLSKQFPFPPRDPNTQTAAQCQDAAKDVLRNHSYYRPTINPRRSNGQPLAIGPGAETMKYGFTRRNPWHSNLDDAMFYL